MIAPTIIEPLIGRGLPLLAIMSLLPICQDDFELLIWLAPIEELPELSLCESRIFRLCDLPADLWSIHQVSHHW